MILLRPICWLLGHKRGRLVRTNYVDATGPKVNFYACPAARAKPNTRQSRKRRKMRRGPVTHGMSGTPTYRSWCDMLTRCRNPRRAKYARYGARGIKVCDRWLTFENFFADMGEKPTGKTLDRRNNNRGYSPSNCRWATKREQRLNSSQSVRWITYLGLKKCLSDWCRRFDIPLETAIYRMDKMGLPFREAMLR